IDPLKPPIKWEFYYKLFNIESNSLTKVCPRLTKQHFELNSFSKMKVKNAVQYFKDSGETVKFTYIMNDIFDALNRKYPAEGIRPNNNDLKVLSEAIVWLDEWESNVSKGLIEENYFLTRQTYEGLRITIGTIHNSTNLPAVVLYAIGIQCLKPPKTGNCTVNEEFIPVISISDLKDIINDPANISERVEKICKLKEKINKIIEDDCWGLDDILLEHNYADSN
ncbi:MULE domain-containing protein, partial [Aphis craccivora]